MATPQEILADPKFHALPIEEKRKVMLTVDPQGFGSLAPDQQDRVFTVAKPRPYTPQEVKERFANFAPAQGSTVPPTNWELAKGALKGAGKFLLDPMGISHGSGLQVTGTDEKGQPMYGVGGPSTGALALRGPEEEFGATMASAPMIGEGVVGVGKAIAAAGPKVAEFGRRLMSPEGKQAATEAMIPHGKEFLKWKNILFPQGESPQAFEPFRPNPNMARKMSFGGPGPSEAGNTPGTILKRGKYESPTLEEPAKFEPFKPNSRIAAKTRFGGPGPSEADNAPGTILKRGSYTAPEEAPEETVPLEPFKPSARTKSLTRFGGPNAASSSGRSGKPVRQGINRALLERDDPILDKTVRSLLKDAQTPFTPAEDALSRDILAGVEREPPALAKPTAAPTLQPPSQGVPFTELESNASHQKINQSIHNALEQMGVEREPRKTIIQEMMDKKFGAGKTLAFTEKGLKGRVPLTSAEKFDLLREIHKMEAPK